MIGRRRQLIFSDRPFQLVDEPEDEAEDKAIGPAADDLIE
jgi:hypothetical protein